MDEPTTDADDVGLTYESPRWTSVPAAELGALALRFLALKIIVDLLLELPVISRLFFVGETARSSWITFAAYIFWHLAVAVVLLAFARSIAGVVFGRRNATVADLGPASWMTLIVSGAGIAFAIFSSGDLITMLARHGVPQPARPWVESIDVLVSLVKVGLGLLCFFAPSLLVESWVRRVAPPGTTDA